MMHTQLFTWAHTHALDKIWRQNWKIYINSLFPHLKKNKKTLVSTSTCIHVHTKKGRRGRERWGEKDKQSNPLQSMARSYWPHPYSPWTLHTHWSHLQVGIFQSDEKQREHLYCVGGGGSTCALLLTDILLASLAFTHFDLSPSCVPCSAWTCLGLS